MFRTASSKLTLAAVATLTTAGLAQAIPVYSLLTPKNPPSFIGDRSQPVTAGTFIYDDINVQNGLLGVNTALQIDQVTVGILRDPGAPASTVTLRVVETDPDGPDAGTFPDLVLGTAAVAGTFAMPAYTGANPAIQLYTITMSGVTVNLEFGDQPGYGQFALGVAFSDNSPKNTWGIHNYQPSLPELYLNLDGAWEDNGVDYSLDFPPGTQIHTTFLAGIEATPVPEPAALSLLALGALPMLRRRRA